MATLADSKNVRDGQFLTMSNSAQRHTQKLRQLSDLMKKLYSAYVSHYHTSQPTSSQSVDQLTRITWYDDVRWCMTHVNIYVCVCVCARGGRRKQDGPNVHWHARLSLTRQLAVETAQCNAERLDGTEWVVVVHCKHVLGDTAELHHDVVNCTQTHTYTHSAWSESVSRPGCMSQAPCSMISFIPTVLKSNVLATESSFSMKDNSSSSQRRLLIDLRCSVLLLLLQNVPNRKWFTLVWPPKVTGSQ